MAYRELKICLLGDSGVGKSSIVHRFVHDVFNPTTESTIGASFMTKVLTVDERTLKFNIWDTAGQERYRALAPMYYRGAGAAVIVFDITAYESFHALKSWVRELNVHGPPGIILAIAGNKCDLKDKREVSLAESKKYSDEIGAIFIETSALSAENIKELFQEICLKVPWNLDKVKVPQHQVNLGDEGKSKKPCC